MPLRAECPAGHVMMVPDHRAGTRLRCPKCGVELLVPGATAKEPPVVALKAPTVVVQAVAPAEPPPVAAVAAPVEQPVIERLVVTPEGVAAPPVANRAVVADDDVVIALPPRPMLAEPRRPAGKPWIPDRPKESAVFTLGVAIAVLACFSVAPAVWEWFAVWQHPEGPPVPPWVYAMLIAGVLQLAYAIYLAQSPDWSALWMTTAAMLAAAAAWATLLGTTLLGRDESLLVVLFRYADKLEGNRAAMWCFVMLCFTSVLAYFLGLTAARWHRSYKLLAHLQK